VGVDYAYSNDSFGRSTATAFWDAVEVGVSSTLSTLTGVGVGGATTIGLGLLGVPTTAGIGSVTVAPTVGFAAGTYAAVKSDNAIDGSWKDDVTKTSPARDFLINKTAPVVDSINNFRKKHL
jgi:hypothetical protein